MTPHSSSSSRRPTAAIPAVALAAALATVLLPAAAAAADDPVWQAYQHIHEALASDTLDGVPRQVEELAASARTLMEAGRFTDELAAVAEAARAFDTADLEAARADFEALSEAVARYAVARGLDVQTFYCPMKEASWLQAAADTGLENPYYGESMLTCGAPVEKDQGPN